jgi:hypothetical protein
MPAARVKNVRMDRQQPPTLRGRFRNGFKILTVAAVAGLFLTAAEHPTQHRQPQTPQGGVTYARTQSSTRYYSIARGLGPGASGSSANCRRSWHSTRLFVRLLRLCAVCLRALWLLRAGVLLQRHIPWDGSMGRLGLWPRLGRPSLQQRWWRKLSRRRRRHGQSQQLCARRRRRSGQSWRGRFARHGSARKHISYNGFTCQLRSLHRFS